MRRILFSSLLGALALHPAYGQQPPIPRAEPVEDPPLPIVDEGIPPRAEVVTDDEEDGSTPPPRAEVVPEDIPPGKVNPDDAEPLDVPAVRPDEAPPIDVKPVLPGSLPPVTPVKQAQKPKLATTLNTDPNARPLSLRVPGPRGQIVDRHGEALANDRVGYYLGVQLPMKEGLSDTAVLSAARAGVAWVGRTLPGGWTMSSADILEHYHKRRWVPLLSDAQVPDGQVDALKDHLPGGVVLRPFYLRNYPQESLASHLIGYMGKTGRMTKGDMVSEELLWPPTGGRYGLEEKFDADLTGKPGLYSVLYNAEGEKLTEEWVQRPVAGNTVVTSLDARFQRIVESAMKSEKVRGAFVILDVNTGDVVAMCSNPGFDPNDWAYGVSGDQYAKLTSDPQNPLIPRALAGQYPPASTFKVVTALAALDSGKISEDSYFGCPTGLWIGNLWKKNHSRRDEGSMNVVGAIKRSCNTWFYRVGEITGGANLSAMGLRLGFGDKTGICLENMEASGNMPTPETYMRQGRKMTGGTLANIAIGQGEVTATPLQVAQMMAAVGRRDAVPRPRLVRQIQDVNGNIIQTFPPSVRSTLTIKKEALDAVRRGMVAVVNGGGGTGQAASNTYVTLAGKTGTGEWKTNPKRDLAWFAGFVPAENPEYAFSIVYEGGPNEDVSGGKTVGPIVGDVFNRIYKLKKDGNEMPAIDPKKDGADEVDGDADKPLASNRKRKSNAQSAPAPVTVAAAPPPAPPPKAPGGLRGWWKRVRNR